MPAATVVVLGSPLSQVASSTGFYELFGVSGTTTLLVTKPGYLDESRTLTVTQDQKFDLQIRPISPPSPVSGVYRMTLAISPSCTSVPDDQKTRTYTATITQDGASLTIRLSDATFSSLRDNFKATAFGSRKVPFFPGPVKVLPRGGGGVWGEMISPPPPPGPLGPLGSPLPPAGGTRPSGSAKQYTPPKKNGGG